MGIQQGEDEPKEEGSLPLQEVFLKFSRKIKLFLQITL
jgi:hypothetical protein